MTTTPLTCPKCGAPLPDDAPEGLCPGCLMGNAFATGADTVKMGATPSAQAVVTPTPSPEELAPWFPQLELLELLGRGGMGAVYKARQKTLNRIVALKILPGEAAADPHFAERLQREAQALARLNHPHIVTVYEVGESHGLFYFLMEFVDGANLRTLIRNGGMKPEAALALIPAFCDALQYAHDEGVVHRDIKPENVLVDRKGRVKIADFGLAKLLGHDTAGDTLTRTGMHLGTPRYMAPEQVDKPEAVDHRADIYSLGVVFYEMLTGEIPMGRFAPPSQKVQVDVRFDEIVLHALERDVTLRYQHASEIKTDMEQVTNTPWDEATAKAVSAARSELDTGKPLPRFYWLRALGLLMLGWLLIGALWNYGTVGCLLGSLVMGGIVVEVALRHAMHRPQWLRSWRAAPVWQRVYFVGSFIAVAVLPFMLTLSAMEVKWETSRLRWNISAPSREAFEERSKGKEYQLIRGLEAFKDEVPATELVTRHWSWRSGWHVWGESGPYHHVYCGLSILASLVAVSLMLWFMIQQMLGAETFSVWRISTGGWWPAGMFTAMVLTSVVIVYAVLNLWFMISGVGSKMNYAAKPATVQASVKQVQIALQKWAAENGYARGDDSQWDVDTVPRGTSVAEIALFNAWKPSPFDRWQMTGQGLRQSAPHVAAQVVGTEKPLQARVTYSASMRQFDSEDSKQVEQVMQGLASAVANAAALDASKPVEEQISRPASEGVGAPSASPWLLFFGVLGLATLWAVLRHGRKSPTK